MIWVHFSNVDRRRELLRSIAESTNHEKRTINNHRLAHGSDVGDGAKPLPSQTAPIVGVILNAGRIQLYANASVARL